MTLLSVTLALTATAQTAGGGISEQMMQQMERQYAAQPANKALRNAIASNAIDNLTKNQDNASSRFTTRSRVDVAGCSAD